VRKAPVADKIRALLRQGLKKTATRWSDEAIGQHFSREVYWLAVPEVMARYIRKAVGTSRFSAGWMDFLVLEHLRNRLPVRRMASLGCGQGSLERDLARLDAFQHCDAFDIAPGAIATAQREARAAGFDHITYSVADLNTLSLDPGAYEAIWFNGSLHHVDALEHLLGQVAAALVPDGYLFLNEYVGARRFAFPAPQRDAIVACNLLIPPRLRKVRHPDGTVAVRETSPLPDPIQVRAADPSEAVRSDEILPIVAELFDVVVCNGVGGSILQFLLQDIAGNFTSDDPEAQGVLDLLFEIEDRLVALGVIPNDFVVLAARPKVPPAQSA